MVAWVLSLGSGDGVILAKAVSGFTESMDKTIPRDVAEVAAVEAWGFSLGIDGRGVLVKLGSCITEPSVEAVA